MPPLIALAAAGCGAYVAYRVARNVVRGMAQPKKPEQATDATNARDAGTLERDPNTGVYRPRS
ncbi:MAG: hypothetical protein AAFR01_06680 [Pseudomonadota bacterium]